MSHSPAGSSVVSLPTTHAGLHVAQWHRGNSAPGAAACPSAAPALPAFLPVALSSTSAALPAPPRSSIPAATPHNPHPESAARLMAIPPPSHTLHIEDEARAIRSPETIHPQ